MDDTSSGGNTGSANLEVVVDDAYDLYALPGEGESHIVVITATVRSDGHAASGARVTALVYPPGGPGGAAVDLRPVGSGSYRADYVLDQHSSVGTYGIEVKADNGGVAASGVADFTVSRIKAIAIDPAEITLPVGLTVQYEVRAATTDGVVLTSPEQFSPTIKANKAPMEGSGRPQVDNENQTATPTEYPARYLIYAKYGGLEAETQMATVSPATEPTCPAEVRGCPEFMANVMLPAGHEGPTVSFPKGNLGEILRLYRETIPVGPFWSKAFEVMANGDDGWVVPIPEEARILFRQVEEEITGTKELDLLLINHGDDITGIETETIPTIEGYTLEWGETRDEFLKRVKSLANMDSSIPGKYHNTINCALNGKFWNGDLYTCNGYQFRVLSLLDSIKFNKDPKISALLNGLDYGPIETMNRLFHQAVVIYEKGTDWRNGIVLDPWSTQFPKTYTVGEFGGGDPARFDTASMSIIGTGFFSHYPTHGRAYMPGDKYESPVDPAMVQVSLDGPVDAVMTNRSGERVGRLPDGSWVSEIESAGVLNDRASDGMRSQYFVLPSDEYEVTMTGAGDAPARVVTRGAANRASTYTYDVAKGERVTLEVTESNLNTPLVLGDGSAVMPTIQEVGDANSGGASRPEVADNRAPVADFVVVPPGVEVGHMLTFMDLSSDADGDALSRSWFINGQRQADLDDQMNWEVDNPPEGEHAVRLVVEDGRGGTAELVKTVIVAPEGDPEELLLVSPEPFDEGDHDGGQVIDDPSISSGASAGTSFPGGTACNDIFSSVEEAYVRYIDLYKELASAVAEVPIIEPLELGDLQVDLFAARKNYEAGDRRAYQEYVALVNRLNSQVTKVPIVDPSELREIQQSFFEAKECYDEMLR